MWVRALEVVLVAGIGLALLIPLLRGAIRKARPAPADPTDEGAGVRSAAERDEARRRWAGRIGGTLLAVAVGNFLAYSVHTDSIGGSADRRTVVEGRYSVSAHGQEYTDGNGPAPVRAEGRYYVSVRRRFTEVTERQWRAVRAHEVAVLITHPLGVLVGGALLVYSQRGRGKQGPAEPGAAADRAGGSGLRR